VSLRVGGVVSPDPATQELLRERTRANEPTAITRPGAEKSLRAHAAILWRDSATVW